MALGFKIKTVKTKNAYTVEELYEAIKDHEFSAGKPDLTKHGLAYIITFPPIDRNNQVWILPGQVKKSCKKWSVQKQKEAGVGNMVVNEALDVLTDGLSSIGGALGKKAKSAEKLVVAVAEELDAMGL